MSILKLSGIKKPISISTVSPTRWKFDQRPGGWIIAESENGERRRIFVTGQSFHTRGLHWQGEWDGSDALSEADGDLSVDADLTAQFPGKVRKILVQAGQTITSGTSMLLMEAMKMEFTIRAPSDGKVAQVLITEGQQVSPGEKFFDFVTTVTASPGVKADAESGRKKSES